MGTLRRCEAGIKFCLRPLAIARMARLRDNGEYDVRYRHKRETVRDAS